MSTRPSGDPTSDAAERPRQLAGSRVPSGRDPSTTTRRIGQALGVAAAVGIPWQAHAQLERVIAERIDAGDRTAEVDVSWSAVSIGPIQLRRSGFSVHAERLDVYFDTDGLHLDAHETVGTVAWPRAASSTPTSLPTTEPASPTPRRSATSRSFLADVPLPVHVRLHGHIELDSFASLATSVQNPRFTLGPEQAWYIEADGETQFGDRPALSWNAQLRGTSAGDVGIHASIVTLDQPPIEIAGIVTDRGARLELHQAEGAMAVRLAPNPSRTAFQIEAQAHDFPLTILPALPLPARVQANVHAERATGKLELERRGENLALEIEAATVSGLSVEHRLLAREPLFFEPLGIAGKVQRQAGAWRGELDVRHRGVEVAVTGRLDREQLAASVSLPSSPCQAVLDALPRGLAPLLEGMRIEGETSASLAVEVPLTLVDGMTPSDQLPEEPPGRLDADLPFFERCRVLDDAPSIDLKALAGPYQHRFRLADGTTISRVMSIESSSFTPLVQIPGIGRAFVVMEDSNFWNHDGFDREQMARAFWYNLGVARPSRGASTITQQTARNLWLGGQRTLSRKLQEAVLAARLEQELPKARILEIYLNIIELGPGVHGVHEAAGYHFGADPEDLNLLQALHLAALAPAPVPLSRRFASGEVDATWLLDLREQIRRMQLRGMITKSAAHRGLLAPLQLRVHETG